MDPDPPHLVHLSTWWTALGHAHGPDAAVAQAARERLVDRYLPVARRYLAAAVGDDAAADELAQEFALKLVRGDFRNARPEDGRFRDYLRRTLVNMATDWHRRRGRAMAPLAADPAVPADPPDPFQPAYVAHLLGLAWDGLERLEGDFGRPWAAALRLRADFPKDTSDELGVRLTAAGHPADGGRVRKLLMEARMRFADLLVAEVADGLDRPTADAAADELIALDLYEHCKEAVSRRWPTG